MRRKSLSAVRDACAENFRRPLSVVTGAAGTGKTSVICAIIRAVRQTEGDGAPITVLAPTGKTSHRGVPKCTDVRASALPRPRSILAWRKAAGSTTTSSSSGPTANAPGSGTIVVGEASMLDLVLMASLMRAIDWRQVRRLILIGDPNRLCQVADASAG
ncbi:AAA family ATPase [Leisingera sp. ANG59]|uniref:AAA family ATPase n=1 Tax=Leisingera sp. ANG59 TaxID=2675221 RepID=UPI00349FF0DE